MQCPTLKLPAVEQFKTQVRKFAVQDFATSFAKLLIFRFSFCDMSLILADIKLSQISLFAFLLNWNCLLIVCTNRKGKKNHFQLSVHVFVNVINIFACCCHCASNNIAYCFKITSNIEIFENNDP